MGPTSIGSVQMLGFRVTGFAPDAADSTCDEFELQQAAIECALLLRSRGWRSLRVERIESWGGEEDLIPIEWAAPAVKPRRVSRKAAR